ncbi:MAG TPA: hypothetical protein VLH40_04565 [Atribacteraceae bacterium]|nr:hypothetical protein [Atribacteraceae bacterium]
MKGYRVQVALPVPVYRTFTYGIDSRLAGKITLGSLVEVELGQRRLHGVVTALTGEEDERDLKTVIDRLPVSPLRAWQLRLADILAKRYFAALGEVLGLFIPPYRPAWGVLSEWRVYPGTVEESAVPVPREGQNLFLWKEEHHLRKQDIERLVKRGAIVLDRKPTGFPSVQYEATKKPEFRWSSIPFREDREAFSAHVVDQCLKTGEKAFFVFPDIESLDRSIGFLHKRFPSLRLIRYDRRLSGRDRFLCFLEIEGGNYDILCGTHIACFLPVDHVSFHIIFDPEERGHVSDRFPRYETLQVLREKIALTGGLLQVVGVNPGLHLTYELRERRFTEHRFTSSVPLRTDRVIYSVVVEKKRTILSMTARLAIGKVLEQGGCAVIWTQKSGYAAALGCRDCGFYYSCPKCETAYRYSREKVVLNCPLCGLRDEPKRICPKCGGGWFDPWGVAVESVFEEIRKGFLGVEVRLIEGKMEGRAGDAEILKPGILVGTSAILAEPLLRKSELMALISLDDWLRIPDFQARERFFLALKKILTYLGTEVASRPSLIVQTSPMFEQRVSYLFESVGTFFAHELAKRRKIAYPPFAGLVRIIVQGGNTDRRNRVCNELTLRIREAGFSAFGPYPIAGIRKRGAVSDEVTVHFPLERNGQLYSLVGRILSTRRTGGVRIDFEVF